MGYSTPGLPVHHQLLESTQIHLHWMVMPSNHLILCCPLFLPSLPQSFPALGSFQMGQLFTSVQFSSVAQSCQTLCDSMNGSTPSGGQNIGVSASTSVLPMNTQDWSPLGWTGWISLQSKGLSRVFSNTTVQNINSSVLSFLHSPTLTSIHDHWKNHGLD